MKNGLVILILCMCFGQNASSQLEEKIEKEGVVTGVIYKDGGEIHGYIKKRGYIRHETRILPAPWFIQKEISFIPKDVFENNEKIKNKYYDKYTPKDCDGFDFDTLTYETVKYADMSAVGFDMIPKKVFMKKVLSDKISLYHYFKSPPRVFSGDKEEFKEMYKECSKINLVYRVGDDGKLKLVNDMNIEKELSDCPMVTEKQSKGEYKMVGSEEESSGFNKLVNNSVFREQVRLMAISDYNKHCN